MDGARSFRCNVAWNTARKRELFEEPLQASLGLRNLAINLAVSSFKVSICDERRPTVPRSGDVDHAQIVFLNQAGQMNVDEIESRRRSPVTEQARFDVFQAEWLAQQGIGVQIDLPYGDEIGGAPIGVHLAQFFSRKLFP